MKASGSTANVGDLGSKHGLMVLNMKVIGLKTKLTVTVYLDIMMVMFTRASGSSIKLMVSENIRIETELLTMVNGEMINKKARE